MWKSWKAEEDYNSGTVRFLRGAVKACRSGVRRCHLISYQEDGAAAGAVLTQTVSAPRSSWKAPSSDLPRHHINDIGGILELISSLEQQGIPARCPANSWRWNRDKFTIIQRDNTTIACAAPIRSRKRKIGEMACVAVHPDYRSSSRGKCC